MKMKNWIFIAIVLVLIGGILFVGVMTKLSWDFSKLSTVTYERNDYNISENYQNISVSTDTANIVFTPSDNNQTTISCYEQENAKHTVSVVDGTLVIEADTTQKWYEKIGINFGSPKITVSIPQGEYGKLSARSDTGSVKIPNNFKFESIDVLQSTGKVINNASATNTIKIKTSTGGIEIENVSATSLDLSVSTGKVDVTGVICEGEVNIKVTTGKANLRDIRCKNLISSGDTGSISLNKVIANEKLWVKRSTGDIKLNSSDANEIFIETDTGDVTGTLLSEKVFITKTDTGSVLVPNSVTGGRCEITTDTGDIKISIE